MIQKETEKYSQIIDAGAALFARQGYRKTTVDEIVAEAGISKGLFYHYFSNKKELYVHLYQVYADVMSRDIREKVDRNERDFFLRLKQIARLRIDLITRVPNLWAFLYSAYYEQHPDIAPLIKEKNESLLQESYSSSASNIDWSKFRKDVSPEKAIELVTWAAEGFVSKITAQGIQVSPELYMEFDDYLEYLKFGMYESEAI